MSLVVCPTCSQSISEWAFWCPNCGLPKKYFAKHYIDLTEDLNGKFGRWANPARVIRGYQSRSLDDTAQDKTIYLATGKSINAKYYDETLMVINGNRVLGTLLGTVLTEQKPTLKDKKIRIQSKKLPQHGVGMLLNSYKSGSSIRVIIEFSESKLIKKRDKMTDWEFAAIGEDNLFSPDINVDLLKKTIQENAYATISDKILDVFLNREVERRITIVSKKLNREIYIGNCKFCEAGINSADNSFCAYCGNEYVCNTCGYCPSCHKDETNDPYMRDARIWKRFSEEEWNDDLNMSNEAVEAMASEFDF